MNGELLSVLEYIEREKGINRSVLIQAVESALASAAKKTFSVKDASTIAVTMDPVTGAFKVLVEDEEVSSEEFGRIAAQTAKQVIIQRIREAERGVIFDEFHEKLGEIVTGTVHRFERGAIVVDLGKTEGIVPKKEQVFKEDYRQGHRIRAYVLEVKSTSKGPEITLSRRNANLVKRLFELEVPEIYESIVEIKGIAREPGERTKIAVYSKDDKVDSVGACVGMRGTRVKNIVRELNGEKIDIVKWNSNVAEYVKAALNPAEISQIKVYDKDEKVEVVVEDDKLSLAIGRRGQNVRLASKLTGWEIDIRSRSELSEQAALDISELQGVGKKTAQSLKEAGYGTVDAIRRASVEELIKVPGVGKTTAQKIIDSANEKLKQCAFEAKKKAVAARREERAAADETCDEGVPEADTGEGAGTAGETTGEADAGEAAQTDAETAGRGDEDTE